LQRACTPAHRWCGECFCMWVVRLKCFWRPRAPASLHLSASALRQPTCNTALLDHLWSAKGATGAGCGVRLAVRGLQERHLDSRTNFKLNRAAALAEWRQLLSA